MNRDRVVANYVTYLGKYYPAMAIGFIVFRLYKFFRSGKMNTSVAENVQDTQQCTNSTTDQRILTWKNTTRRYVTCFRMSKLPDMKG